MVTNSILKARETLGTMVGYMFGRRRDLYEVFGYSRTITYRQALAKYIRQGIASRIVNAPAAALWASPPKLNIELNTEDHVDLWGAIMRADILAGIGEFSILVIGVEGMDENLETPLNTNIANAKITYAQPYSFQDVTINTFVDNMASAQHMKPEFYTINPSISQAINRSITSKRIHYTRVIHVLENALVDEVFGIPRLLKVWNDLEDLAKVSGGSSECFWLAGNRGMQIDVDKDMQIDSNDEANLNAEVQEYIDGLSRFIRTRGVTVKNLGSDTPDPRSNFDMLINLISGTTGIPKRILIGSEAGQLASEQDKLNWAERISERRTLFGESVVLNQLFYRLKQANVIPSDTVIEYSWPEIVTMTPLELSSMFANYGRGINNISLAEKNNLTAQKTVDFYKDVFDNI